MRENPKIPLSNSWMSVQSNILLTNICATSLLSIFRIPVTTVWCFEGEFFINLLGGHINAQSGQIHSFLADFRPAHFTCTPDDPHTSHNAIDHNFLRATTNQNFDFIKHNMKGKCNKSCITCNFPNVYLKSFFTHDRLLL